MGDFVVPSGLNDGTGVAVDPAELTLERAAQVVGRVWESTSGEGVHRVMTEVGLDRLDVVVGLLRRERREHARLQAEIEALRAEIKKWPEAAPGTR